MVEPLSVATACVSLTAGIANLLLQINAFITSIQNAPTEMRGVSDELSSLSVSVESLRANSNVVQYPVGMQDSLVSVLQNCDLVTREMSALLSKMSSMKLARKIQWTISGQKDMNKLRSSLESHKSALNIALGLTSL
jgi:Fungal N-terminal domain of STAND proteins